MFTAGWLGRLIRHDVLRVLLSLALLPASLFGVVVVRSFLVEPFRIPSGAMEPTLAIGDHLLVAKYAYGLRLPGVTSSVVTWRSPRRGDVIVYKYPKNETFNYVHRVVAIAGDTIAFHDNHVVLEGVEEVWETVGPVTLVDSECRASTVDRVDAVDAAGRRHSMLIEPEATGYLAEHAPKVVPEGHVFVAGDNRDHAEDSRRFGFVSVDNIVGKAMTRWMSSDPCASGRMRSGRFGTSVDGVAP